MPADIVGHVSALHLSTATEALGECRSHTPYGLSYALAEEAGAMQTVAELQASNHGRRVMDSNSRVNNKLNRSNVVVLLGFPPITRCMELE